MNSENILAVNIPNIITITLMAMLGFAALHWGSAFLKRRAAGNSEDAEG